MSQGTRRAFIWVVNAGSALYLRSSYIRLHMRGVYDRLTAAAGTTTTISSKYCIVLLGTSIECLLQGWPTARPGENVPPECCYFDII